MKVLKKEEHQVTRTYSYDIPDSFIEETFGSVQRFRELISHHTSGWDVEPIGEEPTDEEYDLFYEFFADHNFDVEDDWWTDRKGGFEVSYEVGNE